MEPGNLFVLMGVPTSFRDLVGEGRLQRLCSAHPRVNVQIVVNREQFAELVHGADAAIFQRSFQFPSEVLRPESRLKWVQVVTAGIDRLPPELLAARHITLTAVKGPMAPLMAEHAVLLMLALARNLPVYLQSQSRRVWSRTEYEFPPMFQLLDKTVAILGVGNLGSYLARICKVGFGMRVLGMARTSSGDPNVDRYFHRSELHAALAEADVVFLCLSRTPDTERIIDAAALAAMKPTAYLINVARGELVDEAALIDALKSYSIAGVGLDTTAIEPLPAESPLWGLPNVIITPHVSPGTDRIGEHMVDFWAENIRRFAEKEPLLGMVDRQAGY